MNWKEPRLRIPTALTVVVLAAGAAAYGCKSQCTVPESMAVGGGGGPTTPDGGQAGGAGGEADCVTTSTVSGLA
jgi:hypothetical protein